jgi:hypothetical protein
MMVVAKYVQEKLAKVVWSERLDGYLTSDIAGMFSITTAQAYRELTKILKGRCTDFPFKYVAEYDGVVTSKNRVFVRNSQDSGHSYWFYT